MALTPDVAPDTPVGSVWGNTIRNRTIQVFDNVAQRDSWSTPPNGAYCVTLDTYTLWFRRTSAWQQQNPQGLLEEYRSTGNFTVSAGATQELWTGGALDRPVHPNHTALISVSFGAWEPTPPNPTVLWCDGLLGAEATPPLPSRYRPLGSLAVRDTNAPMAIAVQLNGLLVWPLTPTDAAESALSIRVKNVGGSAATIDSVIISVVEV